MLKDVTLGQFFPGNSLLHKTDPAVKILCSIAYIVAVFLAKSAAAYGLLFLFSLLLAIISGIPVKTLIKSLKPLLLVVVITSVINIFWYAAGEDETALLSFWKINVYTGGIISAAYMIVRIVCLIIGTSVILTYTTSPIALTDALERLLSPLKVIKLPVHEFSMMMTIAMRFIPTLIEETDKIMSAQKARGADFSSGGVIKRAKSLIPILIPLFISAFRRADELAVAMECRLYRGGEGRTKMTVTRLSLRDVLLPLMIAAFIFGTVMINKYLPQFTL